MSRAALIAVALSLAACAAEDESSLPDASGLYRIEASGPVCDGGSVEYAAADTVVCRWECLYVDGQDVRSVGVTFRRDEAGWGPTFTTWDLGVCD